jgi:hypothetical protein
MAILSTFRMQNETMQRLFDLMESSHRTVAVNRRSQARNVYRAKAILLEMCDSDGPSQVAYVCPTQNISEDGLACFHGGPVQPGTRCSVLLAALDDTWRRIECVVVRSRCVEECIHELGIRFDHPVDPAIFCECAEGSKAQYTLRPR